MINKILAYVLSGLIIVSAIMAFFSQTEIVAIIGAWLAIAVMLYMIGIKATFIQKII